MWEYKTTAGLIPGDGKNNVDMSAEEEIKQAHDCLVGGTIGPTSKFRQAPFVENKKSLWIKTPLDEKPAQFS
jgi:hypothetical protein